MSDARMQPCDGCGQPSPDGWCDGCEFEAALRDLIWHLLGVMAARGLTMDQMRSLRDLIVATLDDGEAQR